MQIEQHAEPAPTPASEIQHVQDYQKGWNDAQVGRKYRIGKTLHYYLGYVDGAEARETVQ